jgi:hypothetical protein
MAQGGTLFLIWSGHLATTTDWGETQGASSQESPINVESTVDQSGVDSIGVGPNAIAP